MKERWRDGDMSASSSDLAPPLVDTLVLLSAGGAEGGGGAGGTVRKRPAASEAQAEPSQAEPKARAWQRVGEDEVIVPPISLHNAKLPQVRTYICGISEARGCKVHVCAAPASRFKNYREIAEKVAAKMAEQRMTKAQAKEYLNSLDTA